MEYTIDEIRRKLDFLKSRCAMSAYCMSCWLREDRFVLAVWGEVLKGTQITDQVVLDIIRPLYAEISGNRDKFPGFEIQNARRGMHQLERSLMRG